MATLFVTPGVPRRDKITVVRDFVVSKPELDKGKAQFYVEYIQLGRIDASKARFSALPPVKVRAGFDVVRTSRSGNWRIAGPVPEPHLIVDAAIRYATKLRANATDATGRQNADKLLAHLKRFQ